MINACLWHNVKFRARTWVINTRILGDRRVFKFVLNFARTSCSRNAQDTFPSVSYVTVCSFERLNKIAIALTNLHYIYIYVAKLCARCVRLWLNVMSLARAIICALKKISCKRSNTKHHDNTCCMLFSTRERYTVQDVKLWSGNLGVNIILLQGNNKSHIFRDKHERVLLITLRICTILHR